MGSYALATELMANFKMFLELEVVKTLVSYYTGSQKYSKAASKMTSHVYLSKNWKNN